MGQQQGEDIQNSGMASIGVWGRETWATTKSQEKRLEVNEMRMLRWMCGVENKDQIRNEHVRAPEKVAPVTKKITEKRLKWYGYVKRRDEGHVLRRMLDAPVPGKRRRGRQKTRWKDSFKRDIESVGLKARGHTGQDKVEEPFCDPR